MDHRSHLQPSLPRFRDPLVLLPNSMLSFPFCGTGNPTDSVGQTISLRPRPGVRASGNTTYRPAGLPWPQEPWTWGCFLALQLTLLSPPGPCALARLPSFTVLGRVPLSVQVHIQGNVAFGLRASSAAPVCALTLGDLGPWWMNLSFIALNKPLPQVPQFPSRGECILKIFRL